MTDIKQQFLTSEEINRIEWARGTYIDDYVDYASDRVDSPLAYHEALALMQLSVVAGRNIFHPLKGSGHYANLFLLLLGPSSFFRKSASLKLTLNIIKEVSPDVFLSNDFSPEGLIDEMSQRNGQVSLVSRDEFAGFLGSVSRQEYRAGTKELLIRLYDGDEISRRLRGHSYVIKDSYFCMIGLCPLERLTAVISSDDYASGFLNRFLVVLPGNKLPFQPEEYGTSESMMKFNELCHRLRSIRDRAIPPTRFGTIRGTPGQEISHTCSDPYWMVLESQALSRYNQYASDLEEHVDVNSITGLIRERVKDHVKRVSMLLQLQDFSTVPVGGLWYISELNLLRAIQVCERLRKMAEEAADSLGLDQAEKLRQRVLDFVRTENNGSGVPRSAVMRQFRLGARQVEDIRDTLRMREELAVKYHHSGTKPSELWTIP